jgi:hypothetical protein
MYCKNIIVPVSHQGFSRSFILRSQVLANLCFFLLPVELPLRSNPIK